MTHTKQWSLIFTYFIRQLDANACCSGTYRGSYAACLCAVFSHARNCNSRIASLFRERTPPLLQTVRARKLNCVFQWKRTLFSCREEPNRITAEWQKWMERKRMREREKERGEERGKDKRESAEIIVHQRSAHRSLVGIRAHPLFVA